MFEFFRHSRRLERLEDAVDRLEHDFKALEMDWQTVYDKVRKAMGRMVKSSAIMEAREMGEEPESAANPGTTPNGRLLTPRQMQIQQQILRRRTGG